MLLGAHMSIEGEVGNALLRGKKVGCDVIQLFTKSNNRWESKSLSKEDIETFKKNVSETGVLPCTAHDAYLINLAALKIETYERSLDAFLDEMDRAELLGIPNLTFHPGSHLGAGEKEGIKRIADSLKQLLSERPEYKLKLLIETTAGQGSAIGYRFEHIAEIMEKVDTVDRIGVCFDTCHVFAAGYDLSSKEVYEKTFEEFDKIIGLKYLKIFHLNDSKRELGSRVDRHEHIGEGMLGIEAFRLLMNDKRFENIPMVLETPKGKEMEEDRINLNVLRGLISEKKNRGHKIKEDRYCSKTQ